MAEQSSAAGQDVLDRLRRRRRSTSCRTPARSPSGSAPSTTSSSSSRDAIEILPQLVRHYGEPFADSSAIPSFYLAELTRRHVTVALNGDGGDERFAGYTRYVAQPRSPARLDRLPARRCGALAAAPASGCPAARG